MLFFLKKKERAGIYPGRQGRMESGKEERERESAVLPWGRRAGHHLSAGKG